MKKTVLLSTFLLLVWGLALPAFAQDSTAEPIPQATAESALTTPEPTVQPAIALTPLSLSFTQMGISRLNINGMFGLDSIYIPFEHAWTFDTPAQLTIHYQTSPLLTEISSLSLLVNGTPISSIPLRASTNIQTFDATIPADLMQGAGLTVSFQGYLRVTDQECEAYRIPGQWVTILPDSTLSLAPSLATNAPQLSDLSSAFFTTDIRKKSIPVLLVMPKDPSSDLLNASAQVLKGLAKLSNPSDFNLTVASADDVPPDELATSNVILLGLPDQQPLLSQLAAPVSDHLRVGKFISDDNQPVPDNHAAVAIARSPWNPQREVLVLSANGAAGISLLGTLLSDSQTLMHLSGSYTFASAPLDKMAAQPPEPWTTSTTTFAQLGQYDRTRQGLGVFDEYYTFYRPAGWVFEAGSTLNLHLAISAAIAANPGSYIAAFINEVPLGSYTLDKLSPDGTLTFDLLPEINQGANGALPQVMNLRIQLSNQYQQGHCQEIDRAIGWATINSDSSFTISHTYLPTPDLQAFPYPFVSDASSAPVTIVVPSAPPPEDLTAALRLSMVLGLFAPTDFDLNIVTSDQLTPDRKKDNLIVLGDRPRQPLIDQLLDKDASAKIDQLYTQLNGDPRGVLYTAVSPNDPQRTILLAFGANAASMKLATDALLTIPPPPLSASGTLAVVEADKHIRVITGLPVEQNPVAADQSATPTVAPTSTPLTSSTADSSSLPSSSWIIIVAPVSLALLLIVLVWAVQKLRRKD